MKNKILKKVKYAKKIRMFLIVLAAMCFSSMMLGITLSLSYMLGVYFLSFFLLIVFGYIYIISFHCAVKSAKYIEKTEAENIVDDIPINPTLPKSKIYCGSKALFSNWPFTVIPYSEVAWVYIQVNKMYGFTVEKKVHIYCKNGEHFVLRADVDEIKWLLENIILKFNQNTIIGYGSKQKKQYTTVKKTYKTKFHS